MSRTGSSVINYQKSDRDAPQRNVKRHYAYCNVMYDIGHDRAPASSAFGHTWKELGFDDVDYERKKKKKKDK